VGSIGFFGLVLIALVLVGFASLFQTLEGTLIAVAIGAALVVAVVLVRKNRRRRRLNGYRKALVEVKRLESGLSSVPDPWLSTNPGETVFMQVDNVKLREFKSSSSTTVGGFGGAAFQLSKSIGIFGGGGSSRTTTDPEASTVLDIGRVAFSNRRVVFVGPNHNREWPLEKLIYLEISEGGEGATVASSGRDKVSELQGDPALGGLVGVYFQIAENSKTMSDLEMSTEINRFAKDLEAQIEQVKARYNL
jgi:hypothetical protein